LVNTHEIYKRLLDVARDLKTLSELPPNTQLVSKDVLRAVTRLYRSVLRLHELDDAYLIPVFDDAFLELYETAQYLYKFVSDLNTICEAIRRRGVVVSPNPCHVHTVDSALEQVVKDFKAVYRRIPLIISEPVMPSEGFLSRLRSFSVVCSLAIEAECLKHAGPRGVIPASLRAHISDLLQAVNRLSIRFVELYHGVSEWKVGVVRLYESPATTQELLNVAEHMANVLHKQVEAQLVPRWVAPRVAVFSLEDRVAVRMQTFGDVVVKPRWVIDVYATRPAVDMLKRVLDSKGFRTESAFYGLKVILPPGDVMEATMIVCMLPSITIVAGGEEEWYRISLARLELLESKLKEQKPLKKRKRGM